MYPIATLPTLPPHLEKSEGVARLSFEPFLPWGLLLLVFLAVLAAAILGYRRGTRPIGWPKLALLGLLRLGAACVILLCLTQPVSTRTWTLREKGLGFLAVDRSASMNLRDTSGQETRWALAGSLLAKHQAELATLERHLELRRYLFDAEPRRTDSLPGKDLKGGQPDGAATNLGGLLERLKEDATGTPAAGALLFTDGRQNLGPDPIRAALALGQAGVPLYIVGLGAEETPKDYREIQIRLLRVPERAFAGSQIEIEVEVESRLPEERIVPLKVKVNDQDLPPVEVRMPKGAQSRRFFLPYTPVELGLTRVQAELPVLEQEANPHNNRKAAWFRVYRTRLRIHYVEGRPRKEFAALQWALGNSPNLDFRARLAWGPPASGQGLLPKTEEDWTRTRLVILGDFPARWLTPTETERLNRFVDQGGSLLMIAGLQNLGRGGWQRTALKEALPVHLTWSDGEAPGPLRLTLTDAGLEHPITQIGAQAGRTISDWLELPPLSQGVARVADVKNASQTLVKAGDQPFLVVQEYGQGRAAVVLGDETWKWRTLAGKEEYLQRFWQNLATWLTRSAYRDSDKALFVETERFQYLTGDEASFEVNVQATGPRADALRAALITTGLHLEGEGPPGAAARQVTIGQGVGTFETKLKLPRRGTYVFTSKAVTSSGEVLAEDQLRVQVDELDLENDNPQADLKLLQRLAKLSGGAYFTPAEAKGAFEALGRQSKGYETEFRESVPLWNHWGFFLLFLFLLSTEWALRRLWGLV